MKRLTVSALLLSACGMRGPSDTDDLELVWRCWQTYEAPWHEYTEHRALAPFTPSPSNALPCEHQGPEHGCVWVRGVVQCAKGYTGPRSQVLT